MANELIFDTSAKKRGLFMANELIFDTSAKKTGLFLAAIHHPKWPYQGTSAKLVKAVR